MRTQKNAVRAANSDGNLPAPHGAPKPTTVILTHDAASVNRPMPVVLSLAHAPAARAIISDFEARKAARLREVLGPVGDAIREHYHELQACRQLATMTNGANRDFCLRLAAMQQRLLVQLFAVRRALRRWGGLTR